MHTMHACHPGERVPSGEREGKGCCCCHPHKEAQGGCALTPRAAPGRVQGWVQMAEHKAECSAMDGQRSSDWLLCRGVVMNTLCFSAANARSPSPRACSGRFLTCRQASQERHCIDCRSRYCGRIREALIKFCSSLGGAVSIGSGDGIDWKHCGGVGWAGLWGGDFFLSRPFRSTAKRITGHFCIFHLQQAVHHC